jgi:beta-galactosidase
VLASYQHPQWGGYAAITRNGYGNGEVTYVGCMPGDAVISAVLGQAVERAGLKGPAQSLHWPLIARSGTNAQGRAIHYLLNYSATAQSLVYPFAGGTDLLTGSTAKGGGTMTLQPWGVAIIEEARR